MNSSALNLAECSIAKSELILGGQKSGKSRRAELLARQWLGQHAAHGAVLIATAQPWDDEMRQRIARHQRDRAQRVPGMVTVEEPLALAQAIQTHSRPDTLVVVDCLTLWLTNLLMPATLDTAGAIQSDGDSAGEIQTDVQRGLLPLPLGEGRGEGYPRQSDPNIRPHPNPFPRGEGIHPHQFDSPADTAATYKENGPLALMQKALADSLLIAIKQAPGPLILVGNEIGLGVIPLGRELRAFVDALGCLNQDVAATCQRVTLMAAGLPLILKDTP